MELAAPSLTSNGSAAGGNYGYDNIMSWFDNVTENAAMVQRETLRRILELNYGVEYLKKWLGEGDEDMKMKIQEMEACALESLYTSLVPVASHADFEPFIQRIADGDTAPILTQQPITTLSLSSGTTEGRQKFLPFTGHSSQTTLQIFMLAAAYRSRVYPIRDGGKILEFIYSGKQFKTKGGLKAGTATTHYYSSDEFKIKQKKTKSFTCSPQQVISGGDYKQSTYCHLLLGLFFSDQVEFVTSAFAYSIVQAFASFEELWEEICNDIKHGTLSSKITLPRMRKAVLDIMNPNPNPFLASRIEAICEELRGLEWCGLIPKLWPNAKQKQDWTSSPTVDFIEDRPVPISQVKVGQEYEIVLTTFTGLYRYRLGDVVEVAGFHNGTPKLNFICRRRLILTINIDKNTEKDLQLVVERGTQLLSDYRAELVDFTSHADKVHQPGHYIIYWEINGKVEERVLSECCREMDASFADHGYVVSRRSNSIGPLELCIVERGTFKKILDHFIGNGAALSQFKTPRCTSNQMLLRILDVCTIKRFHSTAYS
ncbi:GH3 auxin-responsive promoter [Corchorus olitorius]|uniref:GH3 auxin-responsive promoter n=1 Tax=Corchorus olitorius TaxID=93759 RepID=A0A1R3GH30_9ROSI|nr:GH3 auxin-responsive promoter [Corchorus olitorius]